jgi:hypothetical protein
MSNAVSIFLLYIRHDEVRTIFHKRSLQISMLNFLPQNFKNPFVLFVLSVFYLYFLSSPALARVLVKDGVKLPLVAENTVYPQITGKVLVNSEDPLFSEESEEQEPLSAYEILNLRKRARGEETTESANPALSSESESGFGEVLGSSPSDPQIFYPQPSGVPEITFEEIESHLASGIGTLKAQTGIFVETLRALGATSLASTDIAGSTTFGGTMIIDKGTDIDVIGDTLRLQPLGLGGIDFIAGGMRLDREGNLVVSGSLEVSGPSKMAGGLATDFVSPLVSDTVQVGQNLKVTGNLDAESLSVTQEAALNNLTVTGSADFNTLAAKDYGRFPNLIVDGGIWVATTSALPGYPAGTHASAGTATIFAGTTQTVISNTRVSVSSRIFVTPRSPAGDLTLFVKEKAPSSYFIVGVEGVAHNDIEFDWLMIN